MDNYDIIERGKELYETENSAYNRGDIVGMASAQQGMRALEDELMSESDPKSSNSMFYRALKPVLAGACLLTSAIAGAGIAKDSIPSLEDVVVYHSSSNKDFEELFTVENILCDDFYTRDYDRMGMFERVECSFEVKQNNESEPDFYISFIDFNNPVEEGDGSGRVYETGHISFSTYDSKTVIAPVYLNNTNKGEVGNNLRSPSYEPNKEYYLIVHENHEPFQFKGKDGYFHPDTSEFNYSGPHKLIFLEKYFNQAPVNQSEDNILERYSNEILIASGALLAGTLIKIGTSEILRRKKKPKEDVKLLVELDL